MIWYFQDYLRNRQERETLETLASAADWVTPIRWRIDDSLRLIWDADILADGQIFPISLRYPNHFPHSPPLVLPRGVTERWSSHQYGSGGELCLEYGPDNWHPDLTGADMISSAHRLLQGERPSPGEQGTVASRHKTTLGQDLRGMFSRFIVTRSFAEFVAGIPDGMMLSTKIVGTLHEEAVVYVASSSSVAGEEKWVEQTVPRSRLFEGFEQAAALFRWPVNVPLPSTQSATSFRAEVAIRSSEFPVVPFAVLVEGAIIHVYRLRQDKDVVSELSIISTEAAVARLSEGYASLAARNVGIVGCGSLGSKLAAMLARSGVCNFLLIDDDIVLPDNFVRHELDWRDVATHKVDSLARRIELVNPAATCERRRHRLGGQESSGSVESLIEGLSRCDLIVDATADPSVFNYLCAAVAFAKKPLLWAEVFGGGFGGLIARCRPSSEPDPASMRRMIENWCSDRGKPIERSTTDYGGGPEVAMVADDADVTVIASHAARMAIDLLVPRNPSFFPNSVYLIGLAEGWIFEKPFETYPIEVGTPVVAESPALDPQEAAKELARIAQLFTEHQDAASSSAPYNQAP
jgi:molybdopterin/thiamine biosynthesis adenylyltransferase